MAPHVKGKDKVSPRLAVDETCKDVKKKRHDRRKVRAIPVIGAQELNAQEEARNMKDEPKESEPYVDEETIKEKPMEDKDKEVSPQPVVAEACKHQKKKRKRDERKRKCITDEGEPTSKRARCEQPASGVEASPAATKSELRLQQKIIIINSPWLIT